MMKLKEFPHANDIEGFKDIAVRIATSRKVINPLPGCIGALDGIFIAI